MALDVVLGVTLVSGSHGATITHGVMVVIWSSGHIVTWSATDYVTCHLLN